MQISTNQQLAAVTVLEAKVTLVRTSRHTTWPAQHVLLCLATGCLSWQLEAALEIQHHALNKGLLNPGNASPTSPSFGPSFSLRTQSAPREALTKTKLRPFPSTLQSSRRPLLSDSMVAPSRRSWDICLDTLVEIASSASAMQSSAFGPSLILCKMLTLV